MERSTFIGFANQEEYDNGWDGTVLDKFLDWVEDNTVYLAGDEVYLRDYLEIRQMYRKATGGV